MENAEAVPQEDVRKRVEQFVKLRDMKKDLEDKHKAELAPFNEALDMLGSLLLNELQKANAQSFRTTAGTVSQSKKESVSCADPDALWTHIVTSGEWELLDKKPNLTACRDFIEKHGVPPPGVNYSSVMKVGVRRA